MIYRSSYNQSMSELERICMEACVYITKKSDACDVILSADDSYLIEASEDGKSIFAKIGEAILAIVRKFGDFLSSILEKMVGVSLEGKSEITKVEKMLKRHPEFKDEILEALNSGAMDLRDIQSVKELDEAANEIVHMAKMGQLDPNKITTKWQMAKHKFEKAMKDGTVNNVAKTIGTITTVSAGLILFRTRITKEKEELRKLKSNNDDREKTLKEIFEKLNKIDKSVEDMRTDNQINMAQMAGSMRALKDVVHQSSQNIMSVVTSTMKRFNSGLGKLTSITKKLEKEANENTTILNRMETKIGRSSKK